MSGHDANARPTCTWVTVTDDAGRTHLEARWTPAISAVHRDAA